MLSYRTLLALGLALALTAPVIAQGTEPADPGAQPPAGLTVSVTESGAALSLGASAPFRVTDSEVTDERLVELAGSTTRLVLWEEVGPDGQTTPFYAISLDGQTMATVRPTSYVLKVRHGDFDPAGPVAAPVALAADEANNIYLVQFVTQPLDEFRSAIKDLGGTVYKFMANHAYLVRMAPDVRDQVAALPYVRWVGPYHPSYRIEEYLRDNRASAEKLFPRQRYNIQVFEADKEYKIAIARRIERLGGKVDRESAGKFLMEATLTPDQLYEVIRWDEVVFVDRWSPLQPDVDNVRAQGGADYVETVAGYTGLGVRGEAFDTGFNVDHPDFQSNPLIWHGSTHVDSHGTACIGICFGDGTGDPQARGLMPDGQGIVAYYNSVGLTGEDRYTHTGELLQAPYYAVFQTASVGSDRTFNYTTISADHDTLLFDWDILHTQSQSNAGNQDSRPQAWAKNVVSGGAVNHYNTLDRSDDCWCNTGSIGPASDGRIKPDLCFYYDDTYTTYTSGSGYGEFGGTSGATPSIAGHFGLFFQMWADGIFGNEVVPGGTVFDNRPHMATAKAVMINTANPYPFVGQSHDLTRVHQGWGNPDLTYLYNSRNNMTVIDESEVLANMENIQFVAVVEPGEPELRVTMVYTDPAGLPSASQHRINDLTLKVTSPSSVIYWGNNGLLEGNWSTPGGTANTIDTVENVFIQDPEVGVWTVEVTASEVNEDSHIETPEVDADFALVVSGALLANCTSAGRINLNGSMYACESGATVRVLDCDLNLDDGVVDTVTVTVDSDTEPGGETILLTETAAATADFRGAITFSTTDAPGVLQVGPGDIVTATYVDADDGEGGIDIVVIDTAVIDCTAPVISSVQTIDVEPRSAVVIFDTDEDALGAVRYGTECDDLNETAMQAGYGTEHQILLSSLDDNVTYFYAVDAQDQAGNAATDDNGGTCYSFSTPEVPDFFTEVFGSDNDLDNISLNFIPNGSVDFYAGCAYPIIELPVDPAGGTTISLSDDDSELINLTDGASVMLYGVPYTSFYAGSNGYLTFGGSDTDYTETIEDHFDLPRISAVFDDMNPSTGGTVSYKQLSDRVAVTYENVPEYSTSNSNTFQIVLYFDGIIEINYLEVAISDCISGLSEGEGVSPDFLEMDLSDLGSCGPRPPTAQSQFLMTEVSTPVGMTLVATDDGLPEPPALTYHVVSLPANGSLSEPGVGAITAVPYDLSGDQVLYTPDFGYNGLDEFMFVANDGGVPPEGGDSNNGVVTIEVGGPQPVISFPLDTDPGWDVEGQWAFGQPTGGGTHEGDPTSGYTGDNVYGYNLEGDYPANMPSTLYLTTTALDCTDLTGAELRFRRWLGVESSSYDHANLDISVDGSAWTTLWDHSGGAISESSWSEQVFDISGYADGQPTVYLRWGMGDTDGSVQYPGWNIDDVEIWGYVPPAGAVVTMGWSCQEHGDNGEFCLELGNGDARGTGDNVEPRLAPISELSFDVAAPVESFEATVMCGVDTAYAPAVTALADGSDTVTVQFDPPLPAADCCTITFSGGVFDQYSIATLAGSVNRDLVVNTLDFSAIKARFGQVSDASNFWYDVNADGVINTIDSSGVKARFGQSLPSCP